MLPFPSAPSNRLVRVEHYWLFFIFIVSKFWKKTMLSRNVLTRNAFTSFKGIPPHVDTHSAFEDGIASVSLGSQVIMYLLINFFPSFSSFIHFCDFLRWQWNSVIPMVAMYQLFYLEEVCLWWQEKVGTFGVMGKTSSRFTPSLMCQFSWGVFVIFKPKKE